MARNVAFSDLFCFDDKNSDNSGDRLMLVIFFSCGSQ
jgi:hypothetical protein